ncbi:Hint domain-containing protein [Bradyrhizobium sp.]|uniref:Hint domain-containing protein n=1 Tax=Bradyrhizobium sp. TaxID=376 RepID=UPI003C73132C
MTHSSRRRFLEISAGLAGRVAASGALSLPILASISKRAKADGRDDGGERHHYHCFLRGTRILTPSGDIPVEDVTIGALVETLNGPLPVRWIGHQRFRKDSPSWHWSVAPIRVARFALSDQHPRRDLYLSPKHSLFIDGFLIPVEWLVNGRSIALATMDDRKVIEYFHIELDTHEVVFAEGAPSETLLIGGDREDFANFVEYERLYGREERLAMKSFAPVLTYKGGRGELERLLRLALSPVIDIRDPIQRARDRIAARAELVVM